MTQQITKEELMKAMRDWYPPDCTANVSAMKDLESFLDRYARSVVESVIPEEATEHKVLTQGDYVFESYEVKTAWNACRRATLDNLNKLIT